MLVARMRFVSLCVKKFSFFVSSSVVVVVAFVVAATATAAAVLSAAALYVKRHQYAESHLRSRRP